MDELEKIAMAKVLSGETDELTVSAYLKIAGSKICRKAFPFDSSMLEVPKQYEYLQVEIAVYLLNKRGAEGETAHSENGISRTYEDGDIPPTLLRQIVPVCGVL